MANRKMRVAAAKAERRAESRGEKKRCNSCGGSPIGGYLAFDASSGEFLGEGSICNPPDKKDLH